MLLLSSPAESQVSCKVSDHNLPFPYCHWVNSLDRLEENFCKVQIKWMWEITLGLRAKHFTSLRLSFLICESRVFEKIKFWNLYWVKSDIGCERGWAAFNFPDSLIKCLVIHPSVRVSSLSSKSSLALVSLILWFLVGSPLVVEIMGTFIAFSCLLNP